MAEQVAEFVLRSSLMGSGIAVVLGVLRVRAARVRHTACAGLVMAMLVLPWWNGWGPKAVLPILPVAPGVVTTAAVKMSGVVVPGLGSAAPAKGFDWRTLATSIYLAGVAILLLRLGVATARARRVRETAVWRDGQWTNAACAAPVTVGWMRPRVILPEGWRDWPAGQLEAVLTHEREHAGWRDPLVQWMALANRAIFWFHPLAWWLERRLSALAEEASDAAVLARGHNPREYSGYLLEMAQAVARSGMRLAVQGMGMPGSCLSRRIRQILDERRVAPVTKGRLVAAGLSCALVATVLASATVEQQPVPRTAEDAAGRRLALVLDLAHMTADEQARASASAGKLVQTQMRVDDQAAVILIRGPRVEVAQDFTKDLDRVVTTLRQVDTTKSPEPFSSLAALQTAIRMLGVLEGKKAVIYLGRQAGAQDTPRQLTNEAARAHVALYYVDVRDPAR